MLIEMKNTGVHIVPVQDKDKDGKPQPPRRTVQLIPGVNVVPDGDWESMKSLAQVRHWLDQGECVEHDDSPLSKRPPAQAVKLIKETYRKELLEKWREDDRRAQVQEAIAKQLKSLQPTPDELNVVGKGKED